MSMLKLPCIDNTEIKYDSAEHLDQVMLKACQQHLDMIDEELLDFGWGMLNKTSKFWLMTLLGMIQALRFSKIQYCCIRMMTMQLCHTGARGNHIIYGISWDPPWKLCCPWSACQPLITRKRHTTYLLYKMQPSLWSLTSLMKMVLFMLICTSLLRLRHRLLHRQAPTRDGCHHERSLEFTEWCNTMCHHIRMKPSYL